MTDALGVHDSNYPRYILVHCLDRLTYNCFPGQKPVMKYRFSRKNGDQNGIGHNFKNETVTP